ncbi:carbohydrate sulfotransferase 1-like [Dermatophagoides pteronyssinus]|uniref:carbohydrate sulfotransferase 1-like n=1 Tax=Dermatophagoides pteronyssinus TaxID=6956 RepID=UPI003F662894
MISRYICRFNGFPLIIGHHYTNNNKMFIMEKQKIFLFLIAAGAIFILLQQNSQISSTVNNHFVLNNPNNISSCNNSTLNHIKNQSNNNDESKWSYNKIVEQLSKTFGSSNSNSKNKTNDEKQLEKQKKHEQNMRAIRHKYNFIEKFKIFNGNDQQRVLILGYFRSGSSFIGDLLQQNWKSFYTFEPLHYMSRQLRIDNNNQTDAIDLINGIYQCNFSNYNSAIQYNQWIHNHTFLVRWNRFFWNICKFRTMSICYDNEFMGDVCRRSRYNIIKTVRLRLQDIESLYKRLEDEKIKNLKVIYLVRDPRGIYNSRKSMEWCNQDQCKNLTNICNDMREDLNDYDRLKSKLNNNLLLIRYEDISANPFNETRKLFHDINLEFSQYIQRFLRTHTTNSTANHQHPQHNRHRGTDKDKDKDKKNPYSTYRLNSTSTAWQWTKQLNQSELQLAEQVCNDIIERLNYNKILQSIQQENSTQIN